MKSHTTESVLPANPRFHLMQADGLYRPIPFVFVTTQMQGEIECERQTILDAMLPEARARQQKIFDRYDPHTSARAFEALLGLFGISRPGGPDRH